MPRTKNCPDCTGTGQTSEPVLSGRRGKRHQVATAEALCMTCLGAGRVPITRKTDRTKPTN
jgi:hypothetical protein